MSATIELARELILRRSVTPNDEGCQNVLAERLEKLGFLIERIDFGDVKNLWARRGTQAPLFVFAGHTDVVPPGPEDNWKFPPFDAILDGGSLHGRGSADMKSSIAAMLTAVERFIESEHSFNGSIAFLITSDEEGVATDGTVKVVEKLEARGDKIDWCIVGEATSVSTVGDTIKNGRRGSLCGECKVTGIQGHVAYPERARNPIHKFAPALVELSETEWDKGNKYFSPTTFQISNIHSGTGADNVIPGDLTALFNFRYSSDSNAEQLIARVEAILERHELDYKLSWRHSGKPFLTNPGTLTKAVAQAIKELSGVTTKLSTSGGTSDARFIAPMGAQVIELGPVNSTIHKIDEQVSVAEIEMLSQIYQRVLELLFEI